MTPEEYEEQRQRDSEYPVRGYKPTYEALVDGREYGIISSTTNDTLALRQLRIALATPKWVDQTALLAVYNAAAQWRRNGIHVAVDHIIPLAHPLVCGLNVPWNLRIVHRATNRRKGSTFEVT